MEETSVRTITPGKLTVCTYGGFAPVCFKDGDRLTGHDIDYLTRFAGNLQLEIVTRERPFDGIWALPTDNECDIAGAGIMKMDDRDIGVDASWSDPYFEVKRSLLSSGR